MIIPARLAAVAIITAAGLVGCTDKPTGIGAGPPPPEGVLLSLAAASPTEPGWDAIIPAFADTEQGRDVKVRPSFGPSGSLSREVAEGKRADIVGFTIEPEIARLVTEGRVTPQWNADVTAGLPFGSVVTLVVREGNPLAVTDWDDLLRPGVTVVTADPGESGSATWSLLAAYAAGSDGGRDHKAGLDFVTRLVADHLTGRPASAEEAAEAFLRGDADVLITSENQAIRLAERGEDPGGPGRSESVAYLIPDRTLRIEYPVAVMSTSTSLRKAAELRNFLFTPEGQRIWARAGFRPVDPAVAGEFAARFPQPPVLWTVAGLGGWDTLYPALFDPDNGAISRIYREAAR